MLCDRERALVQCCHDCNVGPHECYVMIGNVHWFRAAILVGQVEKRDEDSSLMQLKEEVRSECVMCVYVCVCV